LVKIVSFLVCLLFTVSCASSSDDGAEVKVTVPFSQVDEALIKEALDTPEISSQLTSSSHAILSSIASKNDYTMPFYDFAVQKYKFHHKLQLDSEDLQYWNAFINYPFRDFSRQEADQVQDIINQIVLPNHPFLSQVPFTLHTAEFLDQFIPDIDVFLDKVAKDIFAQQFSQILALKDPSEAEILLKALLHKAKNSSFPDPEFKYHHEFLANVPFDYFKRTYSVHPEYHNNINSFISQLASSLYYEIAEDSKQLANEILSGLLPSIYSTLTDTSYENAIGKYQESSLQPIDKSYLWDPQEFQVDLLEALPILRIAENNSNLPDCLKIIGFLADDSVLAHLFRHYIIQNFCKPSDLSPQDQPLFWRSLIFSSFTDFSSIFPDHSSQIIEQLQLLSTSLDEGHSLCHLITVAGWGHTSSVYRLLQRCDYFFADHLGRALEDAAQFGHTFVVDFILQRRNSTYADHVGSALIEAAKGGHTTTVDCLLQRSDDIYADNVGSALRSAFNGRHTSTIDSLLQRRNDISADHVGWALQNAAEGGHTSAVDCLLQRRDYISADHVGWALRNAAKDGHTSTVDCILQRRNDISADHVGWALRNAAEGGHTSIVNCLLQRRNDISVDQAKWSLRNAAKDGHTSTVDCILQRRDDVSADIVDLAFQKAFKGRHTSVVELLRQHKLNMNR
jgi:hypothetical protein